MQNCFVNVWEKRRFQELTDGLDKYMFHLVKNAVLNDIRGSQRRETRHERAMTEMVAEIGCLDRDEQKEIETFYATINLLPEERRRIFMMICAEGRRYQEVADLPGISINTVRTQMGRSVKFLRENLKRQSFILLFSLAEESFPGLSIRVMY